MSFVWKKDGVVLPNPTGESFYKSVVDASDSGVYTVTVANAGGTATSSGAGVTKLTTYVPPLVGAEVRVMLAFVDNLDTEAIVWPQVFQVGSLEFQRGTYETKAGLSFEFNAEIPATGYTTPYQRFTAGALSVAP
jgi:hypothetical protein